MVFSTGSSSPSASSLCHQHHHHAHLAAAVLASLHRLSDAPRRALRRRIARILTAASVPLPTPLLGLYFLRRAAQLPSQPGDAALALASPEYQFLAAISIAHKYCEDAAYTNRTWAELAMDGWREDGVSLDAGLRVLNATERALLVRLKYELCVDGVEFSHWCDRLGRWASHDTTATTTTTTSKACGNGYPDAVSAISVSLCQAVASVSPPVSSNGVSPLSFLPAFLAAELGSSATSSTSGFLGCGAGHGYTSGFMSTSAPVLLMPSMVPTYTTVTMPSSLPRPWSPAWGAYHPTAAPMSYPYGAGMTTYDVGALMHGYSGGMQALRPPQWVGSWAVPGA